jgi:hypothetical protein
MVSMNCDKKAFDNKEDAQNRLVEIKKVEGEKKKPKRVYFCPKCEKYHLTSWNKNKKKSVEVFKSIRKANKLSIESEYWIKKLTPKHQTS